MAEINHPVLDKKSIIRALVISMAIGGFLLIVAVLPAEYGIDPVGAGKALGFSRLYIPEDGEESTGGGMPQNASFPKIKLEKAGSPPSVARPAEADNPPPEVQLAAREDETTITVPAGKGIEFKLNMLKYGSMKYEWTADNVLYFDFHGEVKQEKETKDVFFESYTIAYSNNMVGTFLAPFEGRHGWFFRNSSKKDVTVKFRFKGQYLL